MRVAMKNDAGKMVSIKVGFAWRHFFFTGFPFLFHGMPRMALNWWFYSALGIPWFRLMFHGDGILAKAYMRRGYRPCGPGWHIAGPKFGIPVDDVELNAG